MKTIQLKRGDTWEPTLQLFSDNEMTTPFDATQDGGYDAKIYIKEGFDDSLPLVIELGITWVDQINGIGTFSLNHTNSLKLRVFKYAVDFKIFTTANVKRKTVAQVKLDVVNVTKKD